VVDETSKILACFTLSNLPPGLTAPRLPTAIGKENLRMIRTYPNPSDQKLLVEWVPQQGASTLVLRNTAGQALRTAAMPPLASQHAFDLSELPAGWYLVEWQSGEKREVAKIVKK
ncbi:T9SS type A sorting domain-containing protein, partial [Haliscomenobacter sp.]|uniref:T9SS type A sorting domain-containing protein n=1 Tax=Haliscomenobacter sp. TaxID=2717303 RepID=UPI003364F2C7